jgi:FkbM family methyltransferase
MPELYNNLSKRFKKLKLKNVTLIKKGLYNKKTSLNVSFDKLGLAFIDENHEHSNDYKFQGNIVIDCDTLDQIVKSMKIDRVDFIKMDIEGAELEAIEGADKIISKYSPVWSIASYHIRDGEKTCYKVEKMLKKYKYNIVTEYHGQLTTYAWK